MWMQLKHSAYKDGDLADSSGWKKQKWTPTFIGRDTYGCPFFSSA